MATEKSGELDAYLQVRVESVTLNTFISNSEKVAGKPYQIFIRELMTAFNEGRVRIVKTDNQKKGNLYVD